MMLKTATYRCRSCGNVFDEQVMFSKSDKPRIHFGDQQVSLLSYHRCLEDGRVLGVGDLISAEEY